MPDLIDSPSSIDATANYGLTEQQQLRLADILDNYLLSLGEGAPQDPKTLAADNPDLAQVLEIYAEKLVELKAACDDLIPSAANATASIDPTFVPGIDSKIDSAHAPDGLKRLGDYVVGPEIGRGGMGIVFEAYQISLDRKVALKVLPFGSSFDSNQINRFKKEAQNAATLCHPNIVPVYECGEEFGVHYFAMRLIVGGAVDVALRHDKIGDNTVRKTQADDASQPQSRSVPGARPDSNTHPFDQHSRKILRLGIEAASALQAAHDHGIIHRDIKPSNLLLDQSGKIWIADFGLSRRQKSSKFTETGGVVGTLRYMSPEQLLGPSDCVDHRTDIYSLAATLYELLTGQPAVLAEGVAGIVGSIRNEPTPMRTLCSHISPDLEAVVAKGMAKQCSERYSSALEFANDLRCVLDHQPTIAQPLSSLQLFFRSVRRSRRGLHVAAVSCLTSLLCLYFAFLTASDVEHKLNERIEQGQVRSEDAFRSVGQIADRLATPPANRESALRMRNNLLADTLKHLNSQVGYWTESNGNEVQLAVTHSKIGNIYAQLGESAQAIVSHRTAMTLMHQQVSVSGTIENRGGLALCLTSFARSLHQLGQYEESQQKFLSAIEIQQRQLSESPNTEINKSLQESYVGLTDLLLDTDARKSAIDTLNEAIQLQQSLLLGCPAEGNEIVELAILQRRLASILQDIEIEAAIKTLENALGLHQRTVTLAPGDWNFQWELSAVYSEIGIMYSVAARYDEAAGALERSIEIHEQLAEASPNQYYSPRILSANYRSLSFVQQQLGWIESASRSEEKANRHLGSNLQFKPGQARNASFQGRSHQMGHPFHVKN